MPIRFKSIGKLKDHKIFDIKVVHSCLHIYIPSQQARGDLSAFLQKTITTGRYMLNLSGILNNGLKRTAASAALKMNSIKKRLSTWSVVAVLFSAAFISETQAQWLTQSVEIKAGWNAVFLHVDPSHLGLNSWVGGNSLNPITEIWRWESPTTGQFIDDPQVPAGGTSGWASWKRVHQASALQKLAGDTAYLVESTSDYTWQIKGRPVAPRSTWNIKGLNLVGFPTVSVSPPKFDTFLAEAPDLQYPDLEIYRYQGLELVDNPLVVPSLLYRSTPVKRGQAFWMRSGSAFNNYFGPFEVALGGASGVGFNENLSTYRVRLRNLSPNALTVTMALAASEEAPSGQPAIDGLPPLLVRGTLDPVGQTHSYIELPLGASMSWTLAARNEEGSEVEVVLGLDRSVITEDIGSLLAGILQFTDSLGFTEVDVPVSGTVDSEAGLWVGEALVTQVGQYLKTYQSGAVKPLVYTNGANVVTNELVISANGNYVVSEINTDITDVAKEFPLRLIVHRPEDDAPSLLQRVFYGAGIYSNLVITGQEAALDPAHLATARRISVTHLPWVKDEDNTGWVFDGPLAPGVPATVQVRTEFSDQASSPFLHTYHPDHDNLDGRFEQERPQGYESYTVVRDITLLASPGGTNFSSRVAGGQKITGDYAETIQMVGLERGTNGPPDVRTLEVRGIFRLDRISDIPELTPPL